MPQGYTVDASLDEITFLEAPPNGTNNIVVEEYANGGAGATDVWALGAFSAAYGWPSENEYFSDRHFFAATWQQPQTIWASRIGDYHNFSRSVPLADDDHFQFAINARRLNAIRDLVALDNLLPLTKGGEFIMTAGSDDVVTPSTVGFKPQTSFGASHLPAQVVGGSAIYVQDKGQRIRDISYNFTAGEAGGYEGGDLTQWSSHLVKGYQLVDVAYCQSPFNVVWYVRDDGKMIALTYERDQAVIGLAPQDTRGQFKTVACLPEGDEVATYVGVRRVVNGVEKRYIERFARRQFDAVEDAFFVDCGLTYDGRNSTATTLTLTGGSTWLADEELTCTASAAIFTGASDVGDQLYLYVDTEGFDEGGEPVTTRVKVRVRIATFTSTTVVQVIALGPVPETLQGVATAGWTFARDTITGLDHLEGMEVAVLSDGNVEERKTVASGSITLDRPGGVVHVGLPFRSEGESLDVNFPGSETIRDRTKLIRKVSLQVEKTRGLKAGPNTANLNEFKQREFEDMDEATEMLTGILEVDTEAEWNKNGRFTFVQDDPLPASILALIPDVSVGGRS